MMNARNKSIGGNSPGKDTPDSPTVDSPSAAGSSKTARKLMLEEWADRKGGSKRKIQEADAEEYVSHQMRKRAKRLRKLLANGSKEREDDENVDDTPLIVCDEDEPVNKHVALKLNFKMTPKTKSLKVKRTRVQLKIFDSEDEDVVMEDAAIDVPDPVIKPRVSDSKIPSTLPKSPTSRKSDPLPTKSPRKPSVRRKNVKTPTKSPKSPKSPSLGRASADADIILSSPIKKRDSLLGYFNKIDKSPPADEVLVLVEVIPSDDSDPVPEVIEPVPKKRRGRPRKSESISTLKPSVPRPRESTPPASISHHDTKDLTESPAGRPKRGCREKNINYKIDNENSPAKVAAQKSLKRARRLLSGCSPQKSPGKSPRLSQKLAPIFVKAPIKPSIDPMVTKARQEFLMSGIPDRMKLDIERQKLFEQSYECELDLFPSVSHVTQLVETPDQSQDEPWIPFRTTLSSPTQNTPNTFRLGTKQPQPPIQTIAQSNPDDLKLTRPKELVKYLKDIDSGKFLYFRCFKQLRKKFNDDQDEPLQKIAMSTVLLDQSSSNDSIEFVEQTFGSQNGAQMFTEKYKPLIPEEIVVNSGPAYQLKKFLASWQENFQKQTTKNRRHYATSNEDDDFEIESNSTTGLSKAVILLGPTGCGKTNAVYALAQEMNFNVLEINAGSKRTGKKMLFELQEATQSHQVKGGGGGGNDRLFRVSQAQSSEESSSGFGNSQSTQKLSLIMIEDADIVFEQDNGFVDAMYQLVATSKRPVILVANQTTCPHLSRFIASNSIVFTNANDIHAGKWLSMLSIAERRYVGHEECSRLYVHNGLDMRRTILEMQFFLQSGGDRQRIEGPDEMHYLHQSLYDSFTKNQNESRMIAYPVDFDSIHDRTADILRSDDKPRSLDDVLDFYNTIAAAQHIQSIADVDDDCLMSNLSQEIGHFMVEGAISKMRSAKFCLDPPVKHSVKTER